MFHFTRERLALRCCISEQINSSKRSNLVLFLGSFHFLITLATFYLLSKTLKWPEVVFLFLCEGRGYARSLFDNMVMCENLTSDDLNVCLFFRWEYDESYCEAVKKMPPYDAGPRLLDVIDTAIFDYLIGNADRHHYESFQDDGGASMLILLDNAKRWAVVFLFVVFDS